MIYDKKTRRQFLVGSGKVALALPILPSLFPRRAWGQVPPVEKRFIAAWIPLGGFKNVDLYPSYTADQVFQINPTQTIHHTNLRVSPALGSISKIYSAALNPYLSKLNVMRGLDCPVGFSHGENTFLGHYRHVRGLNRNDPNADTGDTIQGYPALPSIDQHLAYSPSFYSSAPVLRSINGYGDSSGRVGLNVPGDISQGLKKVSTLNDPVSLFNALFGVSTPQPGAGAQDRANTITLVDQVLTDLNNTKNGRNISSSDKQKLDQFTTEMFELQNKVQGAAQLSCTFPATPTINQGMGTLQTNLERSQYLDIYTSVIATAIKCGRTKIATMKGHMSTETQGKYTHDIIHGWGHDSGNPVANAKVADAITWMIENMYVPLLQKLDTPEAGGKTFLDNSLVMFGNENSQGYHRGWDRPILLAGEAGGFIKTGNFVDYTQRGVSTRYAQPGVLYNQLMITILQAMGIPPSDPMLAHYAHAELINPGASSFWNTLRSDNGEHPHKECVKHADQVLPIIT